MKYKAYECRRCGSHRVTHWCAGNSSVVTDMASDHSDTTLRSSEPPSTPSNELEQIFQDCTVALTSYTDAYGDKITDMDTVLIDTYKAKAAIETLIAAEVTKARIDELLSSDDTIRHHDLETYHNYFKLRLAQLAKNRREERYEQINHTRSN